MTRSRKMLWALAIVVVGYIGLTSLPSGTEMLSGADSKRAETQDVRARIALADEAGASPEFATSLDNARRLVPAEPALPQVIDSLESAAARAGMRWVAGSPSRLPAADGSWEISLTLNGASRSVPVLLDEIRVLPRLLTVSSVQTRGDAEGIILVTVKFYAYAGDPQAFPEVAPE